MHKQTAVIVCDCWDYHHCLNAVRRLEQFAPVLNNVLSEARSRGVTIIHSPSDCMEAYRDHPARKRAGKRARPRRIFRTCGSVLVFGDSRRGAIGLSDRSIGWRRRR